ASSRPQLRDGPATWPRGVGLGSATGRWIDRDRPSGARPPGPPGREGAGYDAPPHRFRHGHVLIVGLMTGTSLDGVDAALVEVTGTTPDAMQWRLLHAATTPYSEER